MSLARYILSFLLASRLAVGASKPSSSCDGTKTPIVISSQSDADALEDCSTIEGDVKIDSSIEGNLDIHGVQIITGDFVADGAENLHQLTASSLSSIGGTFKLHNLILFTAMAMDTLSDAGSLNFTTLPNLGTLIFDNKIRNTGSITIVNTGLDSLEDIQPDSVGDFTVTGNTRLFNLTMDTMTNMTGSFYLNAALTDVSVSFPNLVTAKELTFVDVQSVSLPSLASVTGKLNVSSEYMRNFSAPSLSTGESVSFDLAGEFNNLSMPELKTLSGDLDISSHGALEHITGFPKLTTIQGNLKVAGNYTDLSFPALDTVDGAVNATSDYAIDCSTFDSPMANHGLKNWYSCAPGSKKVPASATSTLSSSTSSATSMPTDTVSSSTPASTTASSSPAAATSSSSSSSSSTSTATKIGLGAGIPLGVIIIGLGFTVWRLHSKRRHHANVPKDGNVSDSSQWMARRKFQELDTPVEVAPQANVPSSLPAVEAPTPAPPVQLPTSNWLQELPGDALKASSSR
ncbi:Protein ecm33 [Talaromyces islandicus]|uniref:Protein ecm33 n=1 Tax=Talaromyces islandicus TaxID=28573 RepID=A0A0U1LVG9_TALIS|nr:Protein ecm33 [Talaromyces islandicus]